MKASPWIVSLAGAVAAAAIGIQGAMAQQEDAAKARSVWSGVYTAAQAKRGETLYSGACAHCHGARLNGAAAADQPPSPAIARAAFLRKWAGKPVAALFVYVRANMPPDAPGTLTDQQAVDAIAHMFAVSTMPASDKELPADPGALENIVIEAEAK